MVFSASALEQRLSMHNKASVEISRQACERELAARGLGAAGGAAPADTGLQRHLYDVQGRLLPLPIAAETMGLSLRSLHRALSRAGIRYSELHEQQQRQRAEQMLARGLPTIAVAEALQFSDQRSFVRAFERWTGVSPATWRRQQQG
jgi:AraC-like DNA-binding protein